MFKNNKSERKDYQRSFVLKNHQKIKELENNSQAVIYCQTHWF